MNLRMAIDTGRIREMASPMTFRTQVLDITTDQEESIRRPVGLMTDHAPLHLLGLVFKDPGASLFWMAFEAGLIFCTDACLSQACPFSAPVGSMAV